MPLLDHILQTAARGADLKLTTVVANELATIESALAAGVRHSTIIEALQQHGIAVTDRNFRQALARARRRKAAHARATSTAPADLSALPVGAPHTPTRPDGHREPQADAPPHGASAPRPQPVSPRPAATAQAVDTAATPAAARAPAPAAHGNPQPPAADLTTLIPRLGPAPTTGAGSLDDILNRPPDLDALARRFRESRRKLP